MSAITLKHLEDKYNHLVGRSFFDKDGNVFKFNGIVHHEDGFYYELIDTDYKCVYHCCLVNLEEFLKLTYDY